MEVLSSPIAKKAAGLILLTLLFFYPSFSLQAENSGPDIPNAAINEIAWMGNSQGWYYEWLEIYNNTSRELTLDGWTIENAGVKNEELKLAGVLPPKKFFIVCKKEIIGCDFKTWDLSLNDDYTENGLLILKDEKGNVIDRTPLPKDSQWPAGNKAEKKTMERIDATADGRDINNWTTSKSAEGTKKFENGSADTFMEEEAYLPIREISAPLDVPSKINTAYPSGIIISEILPSPSGRDEIEEWIELKNQNAQEVDISGWKIKDIKGVTSVYYIPEKTKITPNGFLVLPRTETKITLNNDGDGLELILPSGNISDAISYEKAPLNQSYNLVEKRWVWSGDLTPGGENKIYQPALKEAEKGDKQTKNLEDTEKNLSPSTKDSLGRQKELASELAHGLGYKESPYIFFSAAAIAVFSGVFILALKNRIKGRKKQYP